MSLVSKIRKWLGLDKDKAPEPPKHDADAP
jgi:hypothetical protein